MKRKNKKIMQIIRESPKARKERVSSGVQYRSAVFADKKKRYIDKKPSCRDLLDGER